MSGKLVRIPANGELPTLHIWDGSKYPDLKLLQNLVREYGCKDYITIERVRVREAGRIRDAWCDENGLSKRLQPNRTALTKYGVRIVGPLVVWIPDPRKPKGDVVANR